MVLYIHTANRVGTDEGQPFNMGGTGTPLIPHSRLWRWRGLAVARWSRSTPVALRRARLILGWVTVYGWVNYQDM